jgi:cyclopropane-fatty-acyl-phospholipid synthase
MSRKKSLTFLKTVASGELWQRWWLNWRLFFIVCSETFGINGGSEWGVSHYLFAKPNHDM